LAEKTTVEAVKKALEGAKQRKFKESVELAVNLKDVDLKIPKNRIDEDVILPKGRGRDIKIGIFCGGELARKSKGVADLVISPEQIEEYAGDAKKTKKLASDNTYFLAEAPLMPLIGKKLGKVLAPRGKMPKPIQPAADPIPVVTNLKKTITLKSKERKTFHTPVGSKDMSVEDIAENVDLVLKRLTTKLERGKMNISSIYIKTTMGPSVRLM
jgi:large subunit ribosomal protein L1